jgi:hypothetical protein
MDDRRLGTFLHRSGNLPLHLCPILAAEVGTGGAVIVGTVESLALGGGTGILGSAMVA